jgi:membrane protease subunit HflC
MMRSSIIFILVLLGAAGITGVQSAFIVEQTEQAVVLQLKNPVRTITGPGLYFKVPFIETVETYKNQILDLETSASEITASDQKRLKVDAFARYRISDPLIYRRRLLIIGEANARLQLVNLVQSALGQVLAKAAFTDIVRDKREELMREISTEVGKSAKTFGIEIVDVRLRRIDLPDANTPAVYKRMQTERERESKEIRAMGEELSLGIRATADRQAAVIIANATRDAERLRGDGEAERNRIYAEAFGKDPEFFAFYRSMRAYEKALGGGSTRLIMSPDSAFFRFFNRPVPATPVAPKVERPQ